MADTTDTSGDMSLATTTTQPSFAGRLQLSDFAYTSSGTGVRRSPRLSTPISSSQSPLPATSRTESPGRITKTRSPSNRGSSLGSASPAKKKRSRTIPSGYAPPSVYAHLPLLPDAIAPNLLILFIGLNPGVETARTGHAYAHPSNHFWRLLYSSGITPVPCRAQEDREMPDRYSLGLTNIVARPSRNGSELSREEMDDGVEILEDKCRTWRPEVVCVVGKSIWESVWRVRKGKAISKAEFKYGWQDDVESMGQPLDAAPGDDEEQAVRYSGARVFVATSTSGLAASLRPEEKERIWKELGDWCVERRKERLETQ
jgi:thymine-DNA glycosylase